MKPVLKPSRLQIRIFGTFSLRWSDGEEIELRSAKAQAMLAMLVTAPEGRRTRAWLQDMLWGRSGEEHGRASLRQCLSSVKRLLGPSADAVFLVTHKHIRLRPDCVSVVGAASEGEFLEGINIREKGFEEWLLAQRTAADEARLVSRVKNPFKLSPAPVAEPSLLSGISAHSFSSMGDDLAERASAAPKDRLRPVVAVLPFAGLDGAGEGSAFGDVVAQDVTRTLSRSPFLQVISHLSARSDQLRSANLTAIKALLGVDYVVYGNVRVSDQRIRLDVDFVDMATGELRWTRDYRLKLNEFLGGGDGVVQEVADAITIAIFNEALEPLAVQQVSEIATHRLLLAGITLIHRLARGSFTKARECLEEVIRREPKLAVPRAWLARWYIIKVKQGWTSNERQDIETAYAAAEGALQLNPTCAFSLTMSGFVRQFMSRFDEAFERHEEALLLDPNHAMAWLLTGILYSWSGEGASAVQNTLCAQTLSPLDPGKYFFDCVASGAHAVNGDYERAVLLADSCLTKNPGYASALRSKIYALKMLERHEDAAETAAVLMRYSPNFTIQKYIAGHPSSEFGTSQNWGRVLADAGIPTK